MSEGRLITAAALTLLGLMPGLMPKLWIRMTSRSDGRLL